MPVDAPRRGALRRLFTRVFERDVTDREPRKPANAAVSPAQPGPLHLLAPEPRYLFDAAAAATAADAAQDAAADAQADAALERHRESDSGTPPPPTEAERLAAALAEPASPPERTELVVFDMRVEDAATLVEGVDPNAEVVFLDRDRDGVEQIAEALRGRTGIGALHIVSHGREGALTLGTGTLDAGSIEGEYREALAEIGEALAEDADLLVYGCNFGAGEKGGDAVEALAAATGADVAASEDTTGAAALGGDWALEARSGPLETEVFLSAGEQSAYAFVLQPGGIVADLELWLRADLGTSAVADGDLVDVWADQSGNTPDLTSAGGARPTYLNTAAGWFNFNPAVGFDGANDFMRVNILDYVSEHSVVLVLRAPTGQAEFESIFNSGGGPGNTNFQIDMSGGSSWDYRSSRTVALNAPSVLPEIVTFTSAGTAPPRVTGFIDGVQIAAQDMANTNHGQTFREYVLGRNRAQSQFLESDVAEAIVYSDALTNAERRQVESYLAVKYGVTLTTDYLDSGGGTVYSVAGFGNDIIGIAKDDGSELDQRISASVNTGATAAAGPILTVSTDADFAAANTAHADTFADGQFQMFGHDGTAADAFSLVTLGTTDYEVLDRLWKTEDTGGA
ncbi:MAG: DUF4347 domain-containing protein, partial [Gammaproteobacteria bacterium]